MRSYQSYQQKISVLERAQRDIVFVFDHFEKIIVSISGGKDSTVLTHLALLEAKRRNRRIGLFFLDEEVVYQSTIDQIEYLMTLEPDHTMPFWLQIEFRLTNAPSLSQSQLLCWEKGRHDIWMRPKKEYAIKERMWSLEEQTVRDKNKGFGFYDVIDNFERCHTGTAFLIGLRAQESPNRWRTVSKHPVMIGDHSIYWGTRKGANCALYPLYDWNHTDVWKYLATEQVRYSRIYDYQFWKGMPLHELRCSSLIHEKAFKSLVELPEFEPQTFNRLCQRVQGAAFAQETGRDAKMFRVRKLPKNFSSWRDYRDHLLATYPDPEKKSIFIKRFAKHLENEFVARQQCRQLVLNDYENNLPVTNQPDPREALLEYYRRVL